MIFQLQSLSYQLQFVHYIRYLCMSSVIFLQSTGKQSVVKSAKAITVARLQPLLYILTPFCSLFQQCDKNQSMLV